MAGHSISEVLSQELVIALWAPLNFLSYSDHLVRSVAKDHPDLEINKVLEIIGEEHGDYSVYQHGEDLVAVHFKLSPVMMYQQLDRRLDE